MTDNTDEQIIERVNQMYSKARERYFLDPINYRADWKQLVAREREHAIEKGYTSEHDQERGVEHLLRWAERYMQPFAADDSLIKAAGLLEAARDVIEAGK